MAEVRLHEFDPDRYRDVISSSLTCSQEAATVEIKGATDHTTRLVFRELPE